MRPSSAHDREDVTAMIESLSYSEIAERLGISSEAARAVAKRKRLQRTVGNDGRARVQIDLEEVRPAGGPGTVPRTSALLAQLEALQAELTRMQAELARAEGTAAGHRADYERERERCDRLVTELKTLAELLAARSRPWWRRLRLAG
jgi:hypothetical protein